MDNQDKDGDIIRSKLNVVVERIHRAAQGAGRAPAEIKLVVVTKTRPVEVITSIIKAGATDLGENYVDEAVPKILALSGYRHLKWHMIGHVQSRKAQDVCGYFSYVHSLDSVKLSERLSRFAASRAEPLPVWLEFNVGGEETKSGWNISQREAWKNLLPDLEKIFLLPNLVFLGAMCVPPYSPDPEASRPHFRQLREFSQFLCDRFTMPSFNGLSMGMSGDFEVAIQEGSTCVRIGQAILGPRNV